MSAEFAGSAAFVGLAAPVVLVGATFVIGGAVVYGAGRAAVGVAVAAADGAKALRAERMRQQRLQQELEHLNTELSRLSERRERLRECARAAHEASERLGPMPHFAPDSPFESPWDALAALRAHEATLEIAAGGVPPMAIVDTGLPQRSDSAAPSPIHDEVMATLSRLHHDAPDAVAVALLEQARTCLAAPEAIGRSKLRTLVREVTEINEDVRGRAGTRHKARLLLDRIAGFDGHDAGRLRSVLSEVASTGVADADLLARAEQEVEAIGAEWDRRYLAAVLADTLGEMGYVVQEGFETAMVTSGQGFFRQQDWNGVAVRTRHDGSAGTVSFDLVRQQDRRPSVTAERAAHEEWCADLDQVLARFDRSEISVQERKRAETGPDELQEVSTDELADLAAPEDRRDAPRHLQQRPGS